MSNHVCTNPLKLFESALSKEEDPCLRKCSSFSFDSDLHPSPLLPQYWLFSLPPSVSFLLLRRRAAGEAQVAVTNRSTFRISPAADHNPWF